MARAGRGRADARGATGRPQRTGAKRGRAAPPGPFPPRAVLTQLQPPAGAAGLGPGKGYVDVSTVDSETSSAIAAKVRRVAGGSKEARAGGSFGGGGGVRAAC